MLASTPASILNQNPTDSGILPRFGLTSSRSRRGECSGEFTRAASAIRGAIDRHGQSRFEERRPGQSSSLPVRDRLGFRCMIYGKECWAFTIHGWRETVGGVADPVLIGQQLKERGCVLTDSAAKWSVPYKAGGLPTRVVPIPLENLEKFDVVQ